MNTNTHPNRKNRAMGLFLAFSLVLINLISPSSAFALTNAAGTVAEVPSITTTGSYLDSDPGGFVLATRTGTNTIVQYAVGTAPTFPTEEGTQTLTALYRSGSSMKVLVWSNAPVSALNTGSVYAATLNNTANQYTTTSLGSINTGTTFNGGKYVEATVTSYDNWVYALTPFESRSDALDAIQNFVPYIPVAYRAEIPRGYVLYLPLQGSLTISASSNFNDWSGVGSANGYWVNDNRRFYYYSTLPNADTTFPENSGAAIDWVPNTSTQRNTFGRYKAGVWTSDVSSSQNYVAILNPDLDRNGRPNSSLYITVTNLSAAPRIYPLTQLTGWEGIVSVSDSDFADYYETDEDGNWTDQDGNPADPAPGGTSFTEPTQSAIDSVKDLLSRITELLTAPVDHIRILISEGSAFMESMQGLYTWLPPEVSSVILSAFIVVVIIGVFKVLL